MKTSNRFLIGSAIAIGVLVVVTVALVLAFGGQRAPLLPENTPEGTVQRFLLAIEQDDWQKAYSYVGPDTTGRLPSFEEWSRMRPPSRPPGSNNSWKASLGTTRVSGDEATVEVIIDVFRPGGPFEDPVRTNRIQYSLVKRGASWLIRFPADIWWIY